MESKLNFSDYPDFKPNYSPVEMFSMGIFGGTYFQIETRLPNAFIEEMGSLLKQNTGGIADPTKNFHKILSGASLEWWLEKKLIHHEDPNGWVEWWIKFYYGRRHPDDSRQISRWSSFVARHGGMLKSYKSKGKDSSKTRQNLLQWACNPDLI
jgi:hypothetical protein